MKFRNTLTPASGFQSAQYRLIEFCCTDLINLIDHRFRATIDRTLLTTMPLNICIGKQQARIIQQELIYYKNLNASIKIFSASNGTIQFHQYLAKIKQLPDQDQNNPS
jgi:tryptophan 2,3-dioxygenase